MTKVVEFRPSAPVQILLVSFCAGDMEGGTRSHVQSGRINSPGGPSKSCCCCTYMERNQVSKCFLSDKVCLIPLLLCLLSLGLCIIFLKCVLAHGLLRSNPSDLMDLKGGKQYPTEAYLQTTALPELFGKGAVDVLTPGALSTSSSASLTPSVTFLTLEHTDKQCVLAHGLLRSNPSDLMDLKGGKQYPTEAYLQTTALPEQFGKGAVDVLTPVTYDSWFIESLLPAFLALKEKVIDRPGGLPQEPQHQ
ncbi:UNVERIFIED_CONTAM: hypothetical protein FKN15_042227 [Acipenser sinensis]